MQDLRTQDISTAAELSLPSIPLTWKQKPPVPDTVKALIIDGVKVVEAEKILIPMIREPAWVWWYPL